MKQFTKHLRWLLASLMLVVGMSSAWAQDPYYTLDTTTDAAKTTNNSYAGTGTVTMDGIEWAVNGNGQMYPWRLGGKSISNTDRTVNTNTAMGSAINKIVLTVGSASSITVNSLKLTVASDASFSTVLDEVTATFAASSDITFEPSTGTEWATGAYYKFTFNVTVSQSSNKFVQFSGVKFYAPEGTGSDPSVAADNVDIAYDATSGQIVYTVSNPVTGGSMSAATTSDWVTLSSNYTSPIAFTCTANTSASERSATVTLTYTYGTKTATKDVTISQAGNPNIVNNISDITETGTYTVKGTIVAKSTRGFIVGDGTGYVYYYNQNYDQSAYNIGDKVKLSGSVVAYGGVFEFNNSTTVTAATESNYVEENPTVLSGADMDSRVSSTDAALSSYVQYQGKLTVSGSYYNITSIDGATTAQGSISFPINTDFTSLSGQTVIVKGYYVGVSSSKYYNTMIGSIEAVAGFVAAPEFDVAEGEYDAAQEVTITCATTGASIYYTLDGTDPTTSSTVYDGTPITISTTTTLKAIASDGTNLSEITSATYTIDARTETHIVLNNGTDYESGHTFTITVGDAFTSPEAWVTLPSGVYLNRANSNLTCTGDNDDLATVNSSTGAVTLVSGATGTINVTIEYPGSENYKPCTGSYTVVVNPAVTPVTGDYVKVTATSDLTDGEYLIVYENESLAFNGSLETLDDVGNTIGVTILNGTIASSTTVDAATFTIEATTNGFSIKSASGYYIGQTSDANGMKTSNTEAYTNTIGFDADGNADIASSSAYLRYNSASNQTRFRYFKSATYTGQKAIALYKKNTAPDTRLATTVTLNPATTSYDVTLGDDFTAPTAALDPAAAGTLTYESSDETVATVNASTGAVTIVAAGTTTITAKFEGTTEYKSSQASYTINVTAPATAYTTIQQLQEAATSTSTDITFQMTDIYVTAVRTNQAWISDGTYGAIIYTSGHGLTAGQKLNGTITGKLVLYNGATEITNFDGSGLTTTTDALVAQTKTIDQVTIANQSLPVKFEGVTYDATAKTFSDGTNTIAYYDQFGVNPTLEDGHVYDITGIIVYYNKLQIAPLAATDVVDVTPADAVEAPVFSPDGGTYTEDQTVTITCATTGASIYYTLDGTDPTTASTVYTAPIAITATTTLKAIASDGTNLSTITEATYTINKPDVPNAKAYGTEYYVKVTDLSQIEDGDAVIIVNEAYNYALSTNQQTNNRKEVEFEWVPWIGGSFTQLGATTTVEKFIIDKEGENFYFYASRGAVDGYIYAASKTANQLKTTDTKSDNAKAAITIENGDATIKFQGANTRNWLMYNASAGVFACYGSGQQLVQLYVERPNSEVEAEKTVTVTDAQECYKTFITPYDAEFDGEYAQAFIVTLSADQKEATLTEVKKVPAGTPIVYKYKEAGTHAIQRATSGTMDDVSANELKVSRGEVSGDYVEGDGGTIYVLNKNPEIGFYPLNLGKTLACGKCYLQIDNTSTTKFIGFSFDGEATGIAAVENAMDKVQGTAYDLQGRRVTMPLHGLYIVNGKKVYMK